MRSTAGPHNEHTSPNTAPSCAAASTSVSRRIDPADVSDITDKGWRMMGLSLCFAIVSAFFPPREPEVEPAAVQARPAGAMPDTATPLVQAPPATERLGAPPLPGMATELAPAPQDR